MHFNIKLNLEIIAKIKNNTAKLQIGLLIKLWINIIFDEYGLAQNENKI